MSDAGVFMYAPLGCTVYANDGFISIFNDEEISGKFKLPCKQSFVCLQNNQEYSLVDEVDIDMPRHSTLVFLNDKN